MTTDTIVDYRPPRRSSAFWWLLALSLLVHAVLLTAFAPWLKTTMLFDREQEAQRTADVRERELQRKRIEREQRQKLSLTRDHARQLKKREDRRRQDALRENVKKLRTAREEMVESRERALARVKRRTQDAFIPQELMRLAHAVQRMAGTAHEVTRSEGPPRKDELKQEINEDLERIRAIKKQAEQASLDGKPMPAYRDEARALIAKAEAWQKQYEEWRDTTGGARQHRSKMAVIAAGNLRTVATQVAGGIDMKKLNNTSAAAEIAKAPTASDPRSIKQAAPADLYSAAVELEQQIDQANRHTRAAELAMLQGTSFDEALAKINDPTPDRPDLAAALSAEPGENLETIGDLNTYRKAASEAVIESRDMARRASHKTTESKSRLANTGGDTPEETRRQNRIAEFAKRTIRGGVVDMVPFQIQGGGLGSEQYQHIRGDKSGRGGEMIAGTGERAIRLPTSLVRENALPGRKLTDTSARGGWLFLDTWYVIGPWENFGRADFEGRIHPPEQTIDLDAEYYVKPFRSNMDGTLRWQFYQTDTIDAVPLNTTYGATFYAYTEVYSDKTREMLVAVASDDAAKVWINRQVIWQDIGQSGWNMDEGFTRVLFHKGFNTVLVRIENGPSYVAWSVLLCPPDVLQNEAIQVQ